MLWLEGWWGQKQEVPFILHRQRMSTAPIWLSFPSEQAEGAHPLLSAALLVTNAHARIKGAVACSYLMTHGDTEQLSMVGRRPGFEVRKIWTGILALASSPLFGHDLQPV